MNFEREISVSGDDVRARLMSAAGPVFADRGYHAATVRDICMAAGVNVASVNYYFGDKETLYVETVRQARQTRVNQYPLPEWPPGTPAPKRLEDFITTIVFRVMAEDESSWSTRLMLREVLEPTGICARLVEEYIRPLIESLLDILSELLPDGTPAHVLHQTAFSVMGQCVYYRVAGEVITFLIPSTERREHFRPQQLADHITRFCLAACGAEPPVRGKADHNVTPTDIDGGSWQRT